MKPSTLGPALALALTAAIASHPLLAQEVGLSEPPTEICSEDEGCFTTDHQSLSTKKKALTPALRAWARGPLGWAFVAQISDSENSSSAINGATNGRGSAGHFVATAPSGAPALVVRGGSARRHLLEVSTLSGALRFRVGGDGEVLVPGELRSGEIRADQILAEKIEVEGTLESERVTVDDMTVNSNLTAERATVEDRLTHNQVESRNFSVGLGDSKRLADIDKDAALVVELAVGWAHGSSAASGGCYHRWTIFVHGATETARDFGGNCEGDETTWEGTSGPTIQTTSTSVRLNIPSSLVVFSGGSETQLVSATATVRALYGEL